MQQAYLPAVRRAHRSPSLPILLQCTLAPSTGGLLQERKSSSPSYPVQSFLERCCLTHYSVVCAGSSACVVGFRMSVNCYCLVCGGPVTGGHQDTLWLESLIALTEDDNIVRVYAYDAYAGDFDIDSTSYNHGNKFRAPESLGGDPLFIDGFICHVSCHQLLHKKLGYKLSFEDVLPLVQTAGSNNHLCTRGWFDYELSNYGGLADHKVRNHPSQITCAQFCFSCSAR